MDTPVEVLLRCDGDLDLRCTGTAALRDVVVSFPFSDLCVELKEFPAEALVGCVYERPLVGTSSRVMAELPSCPCSCPAVVGGKGGMGAREVLVLSSSLLLLLLLVVGSGVLEGTCFRLSSSSCRSVSLFFTIILRLMIKKCFAVVAFSVSM